MASANSTNKLSVLKRLWGDKVQEPLYAKSKAYSLCSKATDFTNEGRYVVISVAATAGGSATFTDALAAQDAAQEVRFFVTPKREYQVFGLDGLYLAQTEGNPKAMVKGYEHEANKARYAFARALARRFWGNGGGSLGRIVSTQTLSSTTLTLRERMDVVAFEKGMQLEFASDDGTGTSPAGRRGAPDRLSISGAIDRDDGTLGMSAALNTVSSITANDYIFRRGDYNAAMTGLRGWVPTSDPSASESFFGLDRSAQDVARVSGVRVAAAATKEETLINASAEAHINGVEASDCFMNPLDFRDLVKELGSKMYIEVNTKMPGVSFQALQINGNTGPIRIISEIDVPRGFAWLGNIETVYHRTAGDAMRLLNEDGVGKMLRAADSDAYQSRMGCYGNFTVEGDKGPGGWVVMAF